MKIYLFLPLAALLLLPTITLAQGGTGMKRTDARILEEVDDARPALVEGKLPPVFDLTSAMPPPGNQGQQGSCSAWSTTYGLASYLHGVQHEWDYTEGDQLLPDRVLSPAFVFNQLNGGTGEAVGFGEIFRLMQQKGCATLKTMPYNAADYTSQPTEEALKEAQNYRIAWAKNIPPADIYNIKTHLVRGIPVVFDFVIDKHFDTLGTVDPVIRSSVGPNRGPHALVITGYNDTLAGGCFRIQNSWGSGWGDGGRAWMQYNVFKNKEWVYEAWFAVPAEPGSLFKPDADGEVLVDEAPVQFEPLTLDFDATDPNGWDAGQGLLFHSKVKLPPHPGKEAMFAVYLYYPNDAGKKGKPVLTTAERYKNIGGALSAYTGKLPLSDYPQGGEMEVKAFVPYSFFDVLPTDQKKIKLLGRPVLFVDGLDAADGDNLSFELEQD